MNEVAPVLLGEHQPRELDEKICDIVLKRSFGWRWIVGTLIAFFFFNIFIVSIGWLLYRGVGIWGIQIPTAWGFAITNFVWWIGIGHAGTFISAILYILHQKWRTSINRFSEAMTIFAVACAGIFPLLHLGRPWYFYWLLPYPDTMNLWPQWRSPLIWDIFAVFTYGTVSLVFWYLGMVPDLASLRDRTDKRWLRKIYGIMALGWSGSAHHWHRYETMYLILAALATPLVISVHSVVGMDFTSAIIPGWHSTIFPPYFVAGAIFSGFAMVLTLGIPMRKYFKLEAFITERHLDNCAKLTLVTGLLVAYGYVMENFMAWYSANRYETYIYAYRAVGHAWPEYWVLITCNVFIPQLLWSKRIRTNVTALFIISLLINVGMWTERYVIVVSSLSRDFLVSSWANFHPTVWDWSTFLGSLGLFFFLFLLFARTLPSIALFELKKLAAEKNHE